MISPVPEEYRMAFMACSVMGQPFDKQLMVLYRLADEATRDKLTNHFGHVFRYWQAFAKEVIDAEAEDRTETETTKELV